jgi:hypothetical protein
MKRKGIWQFWAAAMLGLVALALVGCTIGDSPTIITVSQDQGQGNGPSASPSPGGVPSGTITSVRVSTFGDETCPGGTASPATEPNSVRVTCLQPVTCTPLLADGSKAPEILHGPAPDSFEVVSGSGSGALLAAENPFNGDLRGDSPGTVRIRCSVAGIAGTLDVSVLP